MSELPTFARMVHTAAAGETDKEVFPMPQWECFCCCDTGLVVHENRVIPGYDWMRDLPVLCQRSRCQAGAGLMHLRDRLDSRFDSALCQKLHRLSYEDWLATRKAWHDQKQQGRNPSADNVAAISGKVVDLFGKTSRTANDEREIAQRKEQSQAELDW